MTDIPSVSAAGAQIIALRDYANAARTRATPTPDQQAAAKAKVDHAFMRATYDASLNSLRTVNKMMMGYLLNIEV